MADAFIQSERAWRSSGSVFERINRAGTILTKFLSNDPKGIERALIQLYNLQDDDERADGVSTRRNGRGFGKRKAGRASSLVQDLIQQGIELDRSNLAFAFEVVTEHRDQLFKFLSSAIRFNIFTGTNNGYDSAMERVGEGETTPKKRGPPQPREAPGAPTKKQRVVDSDEEEDEEEEEDEDDPIEDDDYDGGEEEIEEMETLSIEPKMPFLSNSIMRFMLVQHANTRAEEVAVILQAMGTPISAGVVHSLRCATAIFQPEPKDFKDGDLFYFQTKGDVWKEASVVRAGETAYSGVVKAMVNDQERYIDLSAAAYYC